MSTKTSNSSRRAFPRVNAEVPVEIVRPERVDGRTARAMMVDISQNGARLVTDEQVPIGEWIVIRPDRLGAGYGCEVTAIVERITTPNEPAALICRFPQPLDYALLNLFR